MFSSVIREKSENRNKNLLNTKAAFYYYKYMYKWPNIPPLQPPHPPPPKKNPANTLIILYIIYIYI